MRYLVAIFFGFLLGLPCGAAETRVFISGGFFGAYTELVQEFMKETGHTVVTAQGPSMGATPQAIPNRMDRGETVDVVILARESLDQLADRGKVVADSRVDLVRSSIAMAVKSGAPRPAIATLEEFRKALLDARSIAYSDSASGVYLQNTLFPRMGVWDAIKDKSRMIPAEPVGKVVARGEAEIGFQQLSELKHVGEGIDIVGYIPKEAQKVTTFSGGVATAAPNPAEGRKLLAFLASPRAWPVIEHAGLEPARGR